MYQDDKFPSEEALTKMAKAYHEQNDMPSYIFEDVDLSKREIIISEVYKSFLELEKIYGRIRFKWIKPLKESTFEMFEEIKEKYPLTIAIKCGDNGKFSNINKLIEEESKLVYNVLYLFKITKDESLLNLVMKKIKLIGNIK